MKEDVILFPAQEGDTRRCKTCGFVIVLTNWEEKRDLCFCCQKNLKLPLAAPAPCPDCEGAGFAAVHVCRSEKECLRKCPQQEECAACLGRGTR